MAQKNKKSTSKSLKNKWLKKCTRILGYVALSLFVFSILITLIYRWVNPPITPLMLIRKMEEGSKIEKKWMPLDSISPFMVTAAVGGEDANFMNHSGFDFEAIEKLLHLERETLLKKLDVPESLFATYLVQPPKSDDAKPPSSPV